MALVLLCGCVEANGPSSCGTLDDPLARIPVAEARLEHLSLWHAVALVGPARGEADLVVVDDNDDEHRFSATLQGLDYGLALDASAVVTFDVPLQLELQTVGLNARQLLGVYEGPVAGLDAGIGLKWRRLSNPTGVVLTLAAFSVGLGAVPAAWEQLDLQLQSDPAKEVTDAGVTDEDAGPQ